MPFEKIVYPFFRKYKSFLSYSQSVKSLLLVVDHLYNESELYNIIEDKVLEFQVLADVQNKVKPRLIKYHKQKHSLERIDFFLKNLILRFQEYKQFYEKTSTAFNNFKLQIYNTMGYGRFFTAQIMRSLPFLSNFLFDFWEFCIALRKMAYVTEQYNKIFSSFFYIELYDLIMDLKFTEVIDIPTFINKFFDKFIQKQEVGGTSNYENFLNISNDVLTSYFSLISASLDFLHNDGSALTVFSTNISQRISDTLY